jgi:hypothetical protein
VRADRPQLAKLMVSRKQGDVEILRKASAYFAMAELDRRSKP